MMAGCNAIKFDQNYKTLEKAVKKLPKFGETSVELYTKASANQFLKFLKVSIKGKKLRLARLKLRPGGTPLYDSDEMVESLEVKKQRRGLYSVAPKDGTHSGGLSYKHLWTIHEYGTTIKVTEKMRWWWLFNYGKKLKKNVLRIPPRPAIRRAWRRFLMSATLRDERDKALEKSVNSLIRKADAQATELKKLAAKV